MVIAPFKLTVAAPDQHMLCAQMLTVGRVTGMMGGFATREAAEGFWRRMEHITGAWCCNYDGGIRYSMLPHVDPSEEKEEEAEDLDDE